MRTLDIAGVTCHIAGNADASAIVYVPTNADAGEFVHDLSRSLVDALGHTDFCLVGFEMRDWNGALSPWPAPDLDVEGHFLGNAEGTLNWLVQSCIPFAEQEANPQCRRFVAGYSMAGLFSLWSLSRTNAFTGCASVSGSLWYPGFIEYSLRTSLVPNSHVFLSYGIREEKAHNPSLAGVGEATRQIAAALAADPALTTTLVENQGGHFTMPLERITAGIAWLLTR